MTVPCHAIEGGFICTRGRRSTPKCVACHKRPGTQLCDWIVERHGRAHGQHRTCDVPLCTTCAVNPAPDKDLCPTHARAWRHWIERHRDE